MLRRGPRLTLATDDVRAADEELRGGGVRFLGGADRYPWGLAAILLDQDGSPLLRSRNRRSVKR